MKVDGRYPCGTVGKHVGLLPRDEEFDSTSQRQPLGYESN